MSGYQLGQRVRFSDRLVRVGISTYREEVLMEALDLMGISRSRGGATWKDLDWKIWVPTSFARTHLHKGLSMISSLDDLGTDEGFIVQRATLQQGGTHHGGWEEPACWLDHGTTRAYKVAFNMHRRPVHVLPEHIEVTP